MDKRIRIAGIAAAIAFSIIIWTSPSSGPPIPSPETTVSGNERVEVLATDLERPWGIAPTQDRIFITEQDGNIRVFQDGSLNPEPYLVLRPAESFEGGLLGIDTHPDFESGVHSLFVYMTYEEEDELWNKIVRIDEKNNQIDGITTIFDRIPGSKFSNGGVLKFGPDGKLYIGTGSVSDSSHGSQRVNSLEGKILRINEDGTIPNDNPFEDSPVYSLGHRNPKGLAWDTSMNLFVTEIGPTKNDEINLVYPGNNFGWPDFQCSGSEDSKQPLKCFDPSIEPGGIIFYSGSKLNFNNTLIMASLRSTSLFEVTIENNQIESQTSILSGLGRIKDVVEGPDESLYIITSNTDGKGFPRPGDDKLIRLVK